MQKIAFHLNSLQQGGAERVVSNLANRFAKEGYEVVIATEWYGTDEFALDQKAAAGSARCCAVSGICAVL